ATVRRRLPCSTRRYPFSPSATRQPRAAKNSPTSTRTASRSTRTRRTTSPAGSALTAQDPQLGIAQVRHLPVIMRIHAGPESERDLENIAVGDEDDVGARLTR